MAENFYTMLTIVGKNKLSSSAVSGSKVNFKTLKVGDGKGAYYEPSENQTSLVNEVWEGNISSISIDENNSNWIVVETVIPASDGGFFIREAGIFDEDGDMIAISKLAETYKPVVAEGSTKDLVIRIVLEVLNVDTVTIKIDPNVVAATKNDVQVLEAKFEDVSEQLSDLVKNISNDAVLTQSVDYGMNNVIKNDGETSIQPKFTIQGKTVINLLGKDGNCEDTGKLGAFQATVSLDASKKVIGSNGIKLIITTTSGNVAIGGIKTGILNTSKYYCVSAYIKNGNATNAVLYIEDGTNNYFKQAAPVTDTTKFTRAFIKLSPSEHNANIRVLGQVNGSNAQYGYFDGFMIEEITQAQYNDSNFQPSPYVDSYTCLQNPYMEVRHDNLVRNGNGEEGVAWWESSANASAILNVVNKKLQVDIIDAGHAMYQSIQVKPNTNYYISYNCDDSTGQVQINSSDNSSAIKNGVGTFNTGDNSSINFILNKNTASGTGILNYDSIMLIEGTTAPTEYKSCRVERVALETKLTSDDSITYENGEVTGLINWKHKTLYGKDYDWQFGADFTGFKNIYLPTIIPNTAGIWSSGGSIHGENVVGLKYDGSILINSNATPTSGDILNWQNNYQGLNIKDTDSGWAETINPNNDEVKCFMNGWVCIFNTGTRYACWRSIDGSVPSGATYTSTTGTSNSGQTTLNVTSTTGFAVGDTVSIYKIGSVYYGSIASLTATTITFTGNLSITFDNTWIVIRNDNGTTNTSLLNYCKNNVAPNYEGYQLHYKLQNPEPITDDNCHIHGDIPKFDVGDNYLFLDSGIVLGEVANLVTDTVYYYINSKYSGQESSKLKNMTEKVLSIYKNLNYNNLWEIQGLSQTGSAYGNERARILIANFDTNATYTVDYKILTTQSPQIGTIGCSYSQGISTAINNLQEEINNRQEHDSILDEIVDLSLYETHPSYQLPPSLGYQSVGYVGYQAYIPFSAPKKATPKVKIYLDGVYYKGSDGNGYTVNVSNMIVANIDKYGFLFGIYVANGTTSATNAKTYGIYAQIHWTADCIDRI